MASLVKVSCDKCQKEIDSYRVSRHEVELRVGGCRSKRCVDLCEECYDLFVEWLDIMGNARRIAK